jgi:single-stranded-DNA-specific exonuclease
VVGLVAGHLVKLFVKPSFVIGNTTHGLAGSGRSIRDIDIVELVKTAPNLFTKAGGHPQACGFTFKDGEDGERLIQEFKKHAESYCARQDAASGRESLARMRVSDVQISFQSIDWKLVRALEKMEPYGQDNPMPLFLTKEAIVKELRCIGSNGDHCRLTLSHDGVLCTGIFFRAPEHAKKTELGETVDILYTLEVNEWRETKTIQLVIKELTRKRQKA